MRRKVIAISLLLCGFSEGTARGASLSNLPHRMWNALLSVVPGDRAQEESSLDDQPPMVSDRWEPLPVWVPPGGSSSETLTAPAGDADELASYIPLFPATDTEKLPPSPLLIVPRESSPDLPPAGTNDLKELSSRSKSPEDESFLDSALALASGNNQPPPLPLPDESSLKATLALQEALNMALTGHPILRVGQAAVDAARQRVRQETAGYLPRGAYTYSYSRQERPLTAAVGGVQLGGDPRLRAISQIFNYNSAGFSLSQVLFDFGRTLHAIRSAAASTEASRADLEVTRQTVIFNTKQAYYSVLSTERLLNIAQEAVRQDQQHVAEAKARFEEGEAPRFDVTKAQVQLAEAELDLVKARNNVALARETLRIAMGMTTPFFFTLVDVLEHRTAAFDDEAIMAMAYANRPEFRSLRAQQQAATEHVSALKKRYLPSISANAQYTWTGREYRQLQEGWLWGVTLTVPLFDNIRTVAEVGEAQADLRRLQAQEADVRQQVVMEVRQGFLNLRQAEESIEVSKQALIQARENFELAQGRYSTGIGSITELTDAQVSLTSARASNIKALYDYKAAVVELEKAIGQRLE